MYMYMGHMQITMLYLLSFELTDGDYQIIKLLS